MGNFGVGNSNSEVVFENFQDLGGNGGNDPRNKNGQFFMKLGIMSNSGLGNSNSEFVLENFRDLGGNKEWHYNNHQATRQE